MAWRAIKRVASVLRETTTNWIANDAPQMGAALAYYFIFSIGPVLVLAVAIAGSIYGEDAARGVTRTQKKNIERLLSIHVIPYAQHALVFSLPESQQGFLAAESQQVFATVSFVSP